MERLRALTPLIGQIRSPPRNRGAFSLCGIGEMEAALDLRSSVLGRVGSSPTSRTTGRYYEFEAATYKVVTGELCL